MQFSCGFKVEISSWKADSSQWEEAPKLFKRVYFYRLAWQTRDLFQLKLILVILGHRSKGEGKGGELPTLETSELTQPGRVLRWNAGVAQQLSVSLWSGRPAAPRASDFWRWRKPMHHVGPGNLLQTCQDSVFSQLPWIKSVYSGV